jgi:hypothetical protein
MIPRVELVYFDGCPHAEDARTRLRSALNETGMPPHWEEWDTTEDATPTSYRRFGSPTVLVNGVDVSGGQQGSGMGCVVDGAPSVALLIKAIQEGRE